MRKLLWMIVPLAFSMSAVAEQPVFEAHDKFPTRIHGDCDHKECKAGDPVSVPEPSPLPLAALGLGGLVYVGWRRRKA